MYIYYACILCKYIINVYFINKKNKYTLYIHKKHTQNKHTIRNIYTQNTYLHIHSIDTYKIQIRAMYIYAI